jgi:hypothetical protein
MAPIKPDDKGLQRTFDFDPFWNRVAEGDK